LYDPLTIGLKYLRYILHAKSGQGHGIHSPFLYSYIRDVLMDQQNEASWNQIEEMRSELKRDGRILKIMDRGAGSAFTRSESRTVASVAKSAAKPRKYGRLLSRMIKRFQPQTILELGTSLGISTAYMASVAPTKKVYTIEGAQAIAEVAMENFQRLGLNNITLLNGDFDEVLPSLLKEIPSPDFVFIDGNHRREPTLSYFKQLMDHRSAHAIYVFDDIHWSKEMEEAWECIQRDENVLLSVDLFFFGIVFFDPSFRVKQHFQIRY
jgi:predicted O-methyltransferase YrrM